MKITQRYTGAVLYESQGEDLRGADLRGADLRDAKLYGVGLRFAILRGADLRYADLRYADLCDTNLYGADLRFANLRCAMLRGADLRCANLDGATLNWTSHELMAEVLRQHAGDHTRRRELAGLVLVSLDWCWEHFLALEHPEREWALDTLAQYVRDSAPDEVRRRTS